MSLNQLKDLAEKFVGIANDQTAIWNLAYNTALAHRGDENVKKLCSEMVDAPDADAFIFIPDGPLSLQQQFFFGLICGTIGTIVGCAMFDTPNMKALARQATA